MRFLTDSQTPLPFVHILRKLDWDVRTVYEEGTQDEPNDYVHLINARTQARVLFTFDLLRGESGAKVAAELVLNGGRILQVTRGPSQPLPRALGRFFFHQPEWFPFLDRNDGVATISDIQHNCIVRTPEEYSQVISRTASIHFDEYIRFWEEKQILPPRRRRRRTRAEQAQMFDEDVSTI